VASFRSRTVWLRESDAFAGPRPPALLLVTFDFDRLRRGLIRVPLAPLINLRTSMELRQLQPREKAPN